MEKKKEYVDVKQILSRPVDTKVTERNKPNIKLMAAAFFDLLYKK
jgi:hypothetical protein